MSDDDSTIILLIPAALAAAISYRAYQMAGLISGLIVLLFSSWVLFNIRSKKSLLGVFKTVLNPFISFFNVYLGSFTYYTFQGYKAYPAGYRALGWSLIGVVVSMFLYRYWNI